MITITGATGQLGGLILENLLNTDDADQLVAVVRSPEKANDLATKGVTLRQGDYEEYDSLVSAFADVDVLMFISNTDIMRRAEQHRNVVDAAKQAGVGRVVYTSVLNPDADDMLSQSHKNTEEAIMASGIPYTFLRNSFYMDSYVVEVEIAMQKGVYRTPTPSDVGVSFVSRSDIARVAATVLTSAGHENQAYVMTGPASVTPTTFAAIASELSGQRVTHQQITWDELAEDYVGRGMTQEYARMSVMLEQMIASGTFMPVSEDIEQVTGVPAESFASLCRRTLVSQS